MGSSSIIFSNFGSPTMSRTLAGVNGRTNATSHRYPESREEWVERQQWLHDAYVGEPYSLTDVQTFSLFRAVDDDAKVIAETRRLMRDIQFVVDTDALSLINGMTLEAEEAGEEFLEQGQAIWSRSEVDEQREVWARTGASMGDAYIEAVLQGDGTVEFIEYDPRHCQVEYSATRSHELERAVVTMGFLDNADISPTGSIVDDPVLHTYVRIIDKTEINTWIDGELDGKQSGPHNLGVVPLVHLPFLPYREPEHGLWAAHGLEEALAFVDSLMSQIRAVGNRYGEPRITAKGVKIGSGSDIMKFGRVLSGIPPDGDVSYLEPTLTGLRALLDAAKEARDQARSTMPEFIFSEAGANASGEALKMRAAQFVTKIQSVRTRWFRSIARLTEIGVALEQNRAHDPSVNLFVVKGGSILPIDVKAAIEALESAKLLGAIKLVDIVRGLQRVGVVPADADPETYAAEAMDEASDRASKFFVDPPKAGEDDAED